MLNVVGAGGKVSLGDNSIFGGMLMANNRTIELKGKATVSGEIIATGLSFADAHAPRALISALRRNTPVS